MVDKNGETVKEFQIDPEYGKNNVNTKEEYKNYIKKKIGINLKDEEIEVFHVRKPLEFVKRGSDKFTYKIMDKVQQKEYDNAEPDISDNQDIER